MQQPDNWCGNYTLCNDTRAPRYLEHNYITQHTRGVITGKLSSAEQQVVVIYCLKPLDWTFKHLRDTNRIMDLQSWFISELLLVFLHFYLFWVLPWHKYTPVLSHVTFLSLGFGLVTVQQLWTDPEVDMFWIKTSEPWRFHLWPGLRFYCWRLGAIHVQFNASELSGGSTQCHSGGLLSSLWAGDKFYDCL